MIIPYVFGWVLEILGILFPLLFDEGVGQESVNFCSSNLDSVTIGGKKTYKGDTVELFPLSKLRTF